MGVRFDFSDFHTKVRNVGKDVKAVYDLAGSDAVKYAVQNGEYHDVTGRLRSSNYYNADSRRLEIGNSAEYASYVESKGKDVISGGFLHACKELEI